MDVYTLYMHTVPNGKRYIGMTRRDPKKRWNGGSGYSTNAEFYADIKEYGWGNIKHEILMQSESQEEIEKWEVELITKYQTMNPRHGYNFTRGGKYHGEVSDRTRRKLRKTSNPANEVPCMCVETRRKYKSLSSAARANGVTPKGVQLSCATGGKRGTSGKHFVYLDNNRRQTAARNQAFRESDKWDWEW